MEMLGNGQVLETMGSVIRKMYILGWDSDSDDGHTVIPGDQCHSVKLPPGAPGHAFT